MCVCVSFNHDDTVIPSKLSNSGKDLILYHIMGFEQSQVGLWSSLPGSRVWGFLTSSESIGHSKIRRPNPLLPEMLDKRYTLL